MIRLDTNNRREIHRCDLCLLAQLHFRFKLFIGIRVGILGERNIRFGQQCRGGVLSRERLERERVRCCAVLSGRGWV